MDLDHDTWVFVADGEKFLLLRNVGDREYLRLEVVDHETSRNPPARALSTDRPGRQQDARRAVEGGVAAWGHSAMEETDWHRLAEARFAEHAAQMLDDWAEGKRFARLVIAADARTLGALREAMGEGLRAHVVAELAKDLTNLPLAKIEASIRAHQG